MEVPQHLKQPLSIDTNITYSLDLSKFPGLDDPDHKFEPALLLAPPVEIIPSPTPNMISEVEELLGISDLSQFTTNSHLGEQNTVMRFTAEPQIENPRHHQQLHYQRNHQRHHQNHHQRHQHQDFSQLKQQSYSARRNQHCANSQQKPSSNTMCGNTNLAKYALQAIFQNLIYPDVSRNNSFSLDTLVQTASPSKQDVLHERMESFAGKLMSITGGSSVDSYDFQRSGKRKRSCEQLMDNSALKRQRHDVTSHGNVYVHYSREPYTAPRQGSQPLHRRVQELMCQM